MDYGKIAVGALLAACAAASPAAAQAPSQERKLDFRLRAHVEHDTNVSRTSETLATTRGIDPSDTILTPSAVVDFQIPVGRNSAFLRGSAGYSFYDKNDQLDRERLDGTGGVNVSLGPCFTTASGAYSRGVNKLEDPVLVDLAENIQESKTLSLDVKCARETGIGAVVGVSKNWTDSDLALLNESDYERTTMMAGIAYTRPALGSLTVFVSKQETDYVNRLTDDGFDLTAVGLTYTRRLGARIEGEITAAYTTADERNGLVAGGGRNDLETTTYSASVSYRASSRLKMQALVDRSVMPSTGVGQSYDVAEGYRFNADYQIGSRITVGVGAGRVNRESEGASLPLLALTTSEMTTYYGTIRYRQSERISLVLNAGRDERTTNAPQFDYTADRIGVAVEATF